MALGLLLGHASCAVTVDDFVGLSYTNAPGQVLLYRLWVPRFLEPGRQYPLVVFLHGAGERGADNRTHLTAQPAPLVFVAPANQANWPCFMLAPQCPAGQTWAGMNQGDRFGDPDGTGDFTTNSPWPLVATMGALVELTNQSPYRTQIDVSRLYITGLSMGGFGSWEALNCWPGVFKAAVPICGGGDPAQGSTIGPVPVWLFHAADDNTVPVQRSRQMVDPMRALGALARYTEYPAALGIGHGSWVPAYADPGLLPWLFGREVRHGGDGVLAEYFTTTNMTGTPRLRRIELGFDQDWEQGSPATTIGIDRWSARFTGRLMVPTAGDYTFFAAADDRVSLWLDGQPLIAGEGVMTNGVSTNVTLTAGSHTLQADYVENTGRAWLRVAWGPVGAPRPIPQDLLFAAPPPVAPPEVFPLTGIYGSNVTVTLTCATSNAVIRFTRDGTVPTASSPIYTNPITLTAPILLRAIGFKTGLVESVVTSADYLISPSIRVQPQSRSAPAGSNVTLTVTAAGIGDVRYQWSRNGQELPGATNATLTFSNAQPEQNGAYQVVVRDTIGERLSQIATLIIAIRPTIVRPLESLTVLEGETAEFSLLTTGSLPMTFRWRRGTTALTNMILDSNLGVLTISNAQLAHAGSYSVLATNFGGLAPAISTADLVVLNDFDRDGLADVWETRFGFDTNNAADALADADDDKASNRAEYVAGTDPRDVASVLRIESVARSDGGLTFQFRAASNKTYAVQAGGGVGSSWQSVTNLPASVSARLETVRLPTPGETQRFYRLATPAPR